MLLTLLMTGAFPVVQPIFADFGEYQIILDRQLLGRPPPPPRRDPPPPEPPAATAPGWANEYRMTMITFDDHSKTLRVGLQNIRDHSGYLLIKGEEATDRHRFTLVDGDFERGQATIAFGSQQHRFSLESGPAATEESPAQTRGGRARPNAPTQAEPPRVRRVVTPPQREQQDEPPQQSRFQSPEELEAHLQNVQMDAIRTGKPPLPIPLTHEMDDELVREGVLPPQ